MNPSTGRHPERSTALDQLFEALSHRARRRLLLELREDDRCAIGRFDLTRAPTEPRADPTSAVDLRHNHVPHLDEAGFVDWDRETDVVTKGARFEEIRPLLAWFDAQAPARPDR